MLYKIKNKLSKPFQKDIKIFLYLARTSPIIYFISILVYCILSPSYNSFYLLIITIILFRANWIIKHLVFKPIYKLLNRSSLPLLGQGARPSGAINCSLSLNEKLAKSYGMPSGHSQFAWTISTYLICRIIYEWINHDDSRDSQQLIILNYIWKILTILILLIFSIYISYSRVYIDNCHTIQQVTVGAIFGIIFGGIIWYYEDDATNLLRKIA